MIRKYLATDYQDVLNLLQLNIPDYFAPEEAKDLEKYLQLHAQNYFLFIDNDTIVGAGGLNYIEAENIAKLAWDFIHPNHHKKGIGSQLVQYRLNKIMEEKPGIKIEIRTSQLAYLFYEKFGFQTQKITKDYWAEGFDLYHMEFKG